MITSVNTLCPHKGTRGQDFNIYIWAGLNSTHTKYEQSIALLEIWSVRLFSEAALGPWSPPPHCVLPFSPFSQLLLSTSVKLQVATAHLCHQASYCDNSIFSLFIVFREVIQRIAGKKKKSLSIKTEIFLKVESAAYTDKKQN